MKIFFPILLLLIHISSFADSPFAPVMYDAKTERELGVFPPSRASYAELISALKNAGARAVVLKYFLDQAKDPAGDRALEQAMKDIPVFLQASINDSEPHPNDLPVRFSLPGDFSNIKSISGRSGWLPLPLLAEKAAGVGFVDVRSGDAVPLAERYRDRFYPSLWLCLLKYVYPKLVFTRNELANGRKKVRLDEYGDAPVIYPVRDDLDFLSYVDVLRNPATAKKLAGKVVAVGYEGDQINYLETRVGTRTSHHIFFYALEYLYQQLE